MVVVGGLRFHAMCPHHLLPYRGVAHVAYLPAGKLVGFGRLAELVDCFTKRLTLQERATHQIADALCRHLGARGAGCVIEAEQLCLALPGREARSVGRRDQRVRRRDARAPRSEDAVARGREAGRPGEVSLAGKTAVVTGRVARHRARRRGGAGGRGRARGGLRAQPRRGQRPVSLRRRARRRRGALRRRRARPARSARRAGQQRGHRRARPPRGDAGRDLGRRRRLEPERDVPGDARVPGRDARAPGRADRQRRVDLRPAGDGAAVGVLRGQARRGRPDPVAGRRAARRRHQP